MTKTLKDYPHYTQDEVDALPLNIRAEYEALKLQVFHNGFYTDPQKAFIEAFQMGYKLAQNPPKKKRGGFFDNMHVYMGPEWDRDEK